MIPGVGAELCLGPDSLQGWFMECLTDVLCECPDWDGGDDPLHSRVIVVLWDGDRFQDLTILLVHEHDIRFTALLGVVVDGNDIHINNDVVSINVISDSKNESNPIDNSNTNLLIAYGNDSFEVQFSRRTERSDILESVNYISFNMNNKNKIEMHSTESLDTSDNEYEFDLDITSNEDSNTNISLMCVGNFSNIVKDNSFDFHIENMYINEGFSNLITVNGDLSVGTKKPDISKLSGEKSELTEMSAEELAALLGFSTK